VTWFINLRSAPVGGSPVAGVGDVTVGKDGAFGPDVSGLVRDVAGKDVLLAIHGFEVSQSDGVKELMDWKNMMTLDPGTEFVGVLWPGDGRVHLLVDYPAEDREAIDSAKILSRFLQQDLAGAASFSIVSHSLGARVALETLAGLAPARRLKRLILMAGAIDDDCLTNQYGDVTGKYVDEISLLASYADFVLLMAFPLGNPIAGLFTRGHPYWDGALGLGGPDTSGPSNLQSGWQIPTPWNYGHLDYLGGAPVVLAPQDLPPNPPDPPTPWPDEKPAWSAAFVSTRLRK
jgi:hypothetical protein